MRTERTIRATIACLLFAIGALIGVAGPLPAVAQDWPAKNITVIVPLGAGSATDVARAPDASGESPLEPSYRHAAVHAKQKEVPTHNGMRTRSAAGRSAYDPRLTKVSPDQILFEGESADSAHPKNFARSLQKGDCNGS